MAEAGVHPEGGWSGSWADTLIALIVGPLLLWGSDILQAAWADIPLHGLVGTPDAVTAGIASSAGVYLVVFVVVRAVLEFPRWIVQELAGSPVHIPRTLAGGLTASLLLWLNL